MNGSMEREKINKAAQLHDDLKKVNRALEIFDQPGNPVMVRVSSKVGGTDDMRFAYLPKSINSAICQVLIEAKDYLIREMEEL